MFLKLFKMKQNLIFSLSILLSSCCIANSLMVSDKNIHYAEENQPLYTSGALMNIVGGEDANRKEFPWLVNLRVGKEVMCGGFILDVDHVVTAAHCVFKLQGSDIRIIAGDHYDKVFEPEYEQTRNVKHIRRHANFNSVTMENDIALLWLSKSFTLTDSVSSISLPSFNYPHDYTNTALLAGWGSTGKNSSIFNILQKATVPLINMTECQNAYASLPGEVTDKHFCAQTENIGVCVGDSGGPVLCNEDKKVACGIVSFGTGCAQHESPGVFLRVYPYISWINENRNNSSSSASAARSSVIQLPVTILLIFVCLKCWA